MTSPRILLVEDDHALRSLTARALRQDGFEVCTAETGAKMWTLWREENPSLLVLDVMLPDANGFDLFRQLRRESEVPVIFVSARGTESDRVLGLELGADDYLPKPYSTRELSARVGAVLRRGRTRPGEPGVAEPSSSDTITFEGWSVSLARRELRSPTNAIVDLTGAEFDLLATFLSHPQRVLGRERLLELSRDRLSDQSDRSIDVLVSRLRRKLRSGEAEAVITTVRGVGYMFRAEVERA
ncbi:response regulator [Novosphingobium sp. 9]|uniref:response regulator n=1 Tax=Novosphingobium sp. 9 TaxID=2025349 RepID=UPI0021B5AD1E|nr:response regulator transcription factor [Novosphingobium sp. 9]